ncbi:Retinol dehydrogenase 12 [Mortierella sp. 14UC]|nr:Retinol dehydrogenase 12 [Mortierella sp. 14UC]
MNQITLSPDTVVHTPSTVEAQRGGIFYDNIMNSLSVSQFISYRMVEYLLLLSEELEALTSLRRQPLPKLAIISSLAREQGAKAVETIKAQTRNPHIEFIYLDLASLKDVRRFAEVTKRTSVIDLLVNNASKAPKARIVVTASSAHYGVDQIPYPAITSPKTYDLLRNYCGSKLVTVMYVRHLAKTLAQTHPNITVNCLHPVSCNTNLFKNSLLLSVLTTIGLQYLLRPPVRGARTIIYLSLSEEVEGVNGEYWFDEDSAS